MALINDPLQWSEGAERLNSRPHTNLYVQLKQREQAKNEAFDEYVRNLNKTINPAGLRNQEREPFEDKLAKWQQFGMQNREALRNPRKDKGAASLEFQAGYQDLINLINRSKQEEEKKKPIIEIWTDPNKRERVTEDIFPDIQSHDQPFLIKDNSGNWVENPDRKSFDVSKIMFDPKPFEQDKYFKGFDDVKRSDLAPSVVKNPKDLTQTITTTSVYDQGAKDLIATRSVAEFMNNPSFKKTVKGLDPKDYNDLFQRNYGHPIQNDGDLAAAYTLAGLQEKLVKSEVKDDTFERQKRMEAIRFANDRAMKDYEHNLRQMDEVTKNTWLKDYLEDQATKARTDEFGKPKAMAVYNLGEGQSVAGSEIPVSSFLAKGLAKDNKSPDKLLVTDISVTQPDGSVKSERKYMPIFYVRDDDGKIVKNKEGVAEVNKTLSVPQDINALVVDMGGQVGVKQKNAEGAALMGKQPETQKRTIVSSTTSKPTKKEIKRSDIAIRAATAGYSTSEYEKMLKQNGIKITD